MGGKMPLGQKQFRAGTGKFNVYHAVLTPVSAQPFSLRFLTTLSLAFAACFSSYNVTIASFITEVISLYRLRFYELVLAMDGTDSGTQTHTALEQQPAQAHALVLSNATEEITLSEWTPSKTTALDATKVELARIPRAWERVPTLSKARKENGRVGLVWRKYNLRGEQKQKQRIVPVTTADVKRANAAVPTPSLATKPESLEIEVEEQAGKEDRQDRAVKRLRVKQKAKQQKIMSAMETRDVATHADTAESHDDGELGVPTKWDRRRSTLTRMFFTAVSKTLR
jgi:hypothetical protein